MERVYERCCGIDVHKKVIVSCFKSGKTQEIREYCTNTQDLRKLTNWLLDSGCQMVAMESTASYWKPLYNIFELSGIEAMVVNARHIRTVPGRKTDVKDAAWIADLLQHGLLKASYIPDREQRELREVSRYRKSLIEERAREINRLQKMLEVANIKLGNFVSNINGKSSRNVLNVLIEGKSVDEEQLKELLYGSVRNKTSDIMLAVDGIMSTLQKQLIKNVINHIDDMTMRIKDMDQLMKKYLDKYQKAINDIEKIPGIGKQSGETILAEIGLDINRFPSAAHLSRWAGVAPGNNESAGKRTSGKTTKGNNTLKTTLVQCAKVASKKKGTFFYSQYQRIAVRRGRNRATMAVAHSMLIAIYYMLKNNEPYKDLGADYYNQFNRERKINGYLKKLSALGWEQSKLAVETALA
jgi:transposase